MAKLTFAEQIKHPNWQKKRLEVMEDAGFECESCGTKEVTLNIHHKRYVKGRMYWDYTREELACLCEDCHKQEHAHRELLDLILTQASESHGNAVQTAIGLLAGYFSGCVSIDRDLALAAIEVDGFSHDLGIMASMAGGASWPKMVEAADILTKRRSPAEDAAYLRWKGEA